MRLRGYQELSLVVYLEWCEMNREVKGVVYGSVMVVCILIWFIVAVIDYFQRINKNNDDN